MSTLRTQHKHIIPFERTGGKCNRLILYSHGSDPLEDCRNSLPNANAHCGQAVVGFAVDHGVEEGCGDAGGKALIFMGYKAETAIFKESGINLAYLCE